LRAKFDSAYDKNNLEEIINVEEDAMYARLEELSKPRVNRELKRMHLNHIIEWTARNNYPGNQRQIDLLVTAIRANQKSPDLLSKLSSHLQDVSSMSNQVHSKKDGKFRQINPSRHVINFTPGSISSWLAILIYGSFVFAFNLLDNLSQVVQIFFLGVFAFTIYLSIGRLFTASALLKGALAVALTIMYMNIYSFWSHVKAEPLRLSAEVDGPQVEYPAWLLADDISANEKNCGQRLVISKNENLSSLKIVYSDTAIEVRDHECNTLLSDFIVPNSTSNPQVYFLQPKTLRGLLQRRSTIVKVEWLDAKACEIKTQKININLESLIWYYSRQAWSAGLAGAIAVLILDIVKSRIKLVHN